MNFSQLMGMASGHVEARIVQTAVQLGIFETLGHSAMTAEAVAAGLNLDSRATEILLNALAAIQLLSKEGKSFSLTPISMQYLLQSSPNYVGGMIRFDGFLWHCWEGLSESVRSGRPARLPNMYQDDPNETEIFINAMDSLVKARGDTDVIANFLNWDEIDQLLDVGAGPATYPIELCKKFPNLRATIFDLPATLRITARYLSEAAMEDRIKLLPGDYRVEPIPGSYDVIFLSNIIHGEGDYENRQLLQKLSANLRTRGRIIIKDHILDESRAYPPVGALFSLLMLLTTVSGRCYSFGEIRSWLEDAGLTYVRHVELPPPLTSSLIIGEK
jgi:hypothetical protein